MAGSDGVGRKADPVTKAGKLTIGKMARVDAMIAFKEALDAKGINQFKLALKLNQALNAKFVKVFWDSKTGQVIESKTYIDHGTRLKAVEMIVKYFNLEPNQKIDVDANFGIRNMSDEELNRKIEDLTAILGISAAPAGAGPETEE